MLSCPYCGHECAALIESSTECTMVRCRCCQATWSVRPWVRLATQDLTRPATPGDAVAEPVHDKEDQ